MRLTLSRLLLPFVLAASLFATGCCCFLVGAGAGAAGYAYSMGHLTAQRDVPINTAYDASVHALEDLRIPIKEKHSDELAASIRAMTADGKEVHINLKRMSDRTTSFSIYTLPLPDKDRTMAIYDHIITRLPGGSTSNP